MPKLKTSTKIPKIIQMDHGVDRYMYVLCEDGSMWRKWTGCLTDPWTRVPLGKKVDE